MTNRKSTKRALLASLLALVLCFSMMLGTTYAWFTDSVTSTGNIIKSGTLDVAMHWADGTKAVPANDSADWADASAGPIFNYTLWEPGYTQVRHIKIENIGTLGLKYQLAIEANGAVSDLSDVIDVYYTDPADQVADRTVLTNKLGTLTEVLAAFDSTAAGELKPGESHVVTLALKMQETAGNEYQDKAIGADFSVILYATQLAYEEDSFDKNYDDNAEYNLPVVYDAATMGGLVDAFSSLKSGDTLVLPEGTYNTSGTFHIPAGVTVKGEAGKEVVIHQLSAAQDDIFNCAGDAVIQNITFESNRKGYAIAGDVKAHDGNGNITVINCKFKGTSDKNWGIYKNLNGDLVVQNCTFDTYNNAICGVNNGGESTTTITGCTFTNINGEAIGYITASVPADFESAAIANNTGLTAENVIGY